MSVEQRSAKEATPIEVLRQLREVLRELERMGVGRAKDQGVAPAERKREAEQLDRERRGVPIRFKR